MTGHFTDADLERYLDGALTPEALLEADDPQAALARRTLARIAPPVSPSATP